MGKLYQALSSGHEIENDKSQFELKFQNNGLTRINAEEDKLVLEK